MRYNYNFRVVEFFKFNPAVDQQAEPLDTACRPLGFKYETQFRDILSFWVFFSYIPEAL